MATYSGVVHAIGECRTCGQDFNGYKNCRANAAKHAKRTGHHVVVEQAISVSYNDPRGDE